MKKVKVRPLDLGKYPSRMRGKPLAYMAEWAAAALTVTWVTAVLSYAPADGSPPSTLMTLVLLFVPITLIFGVLVTLRSVRALRNEAARLQASVDAMRKAFLSGQNQIDPAMQPAVARKLDEIAQQTQQTQATLVNMAAKVGKGADAGRASARAVPTPKALMPPEEPALALGAQPDPAGSPLTVDEFIRAMNFPDGPDDTAGFAAMRAALSNRDIAKLIRAAQTLLKLLAQDGIYMDDLKHDPAAPNAWRLFAKGERGRAVAALGGVRDRSALALSVGRLRNDPVFRDAAHHFLRAFDRCLAEFEPNAEDADLAALASTRTARAFMLLGRVLGTFD
jgi:hypothetical protein